MKNELIENYLKLYEETSSSNIYELGFVLNGRLYMIELKHIPTYMVRVTTESKERKSLVKLRLYLNKKNKLELLNSGKCADLMSEEQFLQLVEEYELNRGQTFEKIRKDQRQIEYRLDNIRYDIDSDININDKHIQVKYENGTIARINTINKIISK